MVFINKFPKYDSEFQQEINKLKAEIASTENQINKLE